MASTRPVCGVHHHHAALDVGHLAQRVGLRRIGLGVGAVRLVDLLDHDHVADAHHVGGRRGGAADALVGQRRPRPGHLGEGHRAVALAIVAAGRRCCTDWASTLVTTASCQAGGPLSGRRWAMRANSSSQTAHVGDLGVGTAPAVAAVVGDQAVAQRLVGDRLDGGIERGADGEAALVEALLAVGRQQVAAHFLGEEVGLSRPRWRRGGAAAASRPWPAASRPG